LIELDTITNPDDITKLEDYELREAILECAAMMAVARAKQNATTDAYNQHLAAKAKFSAYRQLGSLFQSALRAAVALNQ
jgi:hypothetical protein